MKVTERILAFGITGSSKSYQWLLIAKQLKPKGVKFRVIDTDSSITFMLNEDEQFNELLPENKGNVYVFEAYDFRTLRIAQRWLIQGKLSDDAIKEIKDIDPYLIEAYRDPIKRTDWQVLDMADRPWEAVQEAYIEEVFGESYGDFFVHVRREMHKKGDVDSKGRPISSTDREALEGWKDWTVINKMYYSWFNPIPYRAKCNTYATAKVKEVPKTESDPELIDIYGPWKVMPTGQKNLGHAFHTLFLFAPIYKKGQDQAWGLSTVKDRRNRKYFKKDPLVNLYFQYLVKEAGWEI